MNNFQSAKQASYLISGHVPEFFRETLFEHQYATPKIDKLFKWLTQCTRG